MRETPNIEHSLIILKPDAVQRNLLGQIIQRFERKGLKIVGIKMIQAEDILLDEHYSHLKEKPFFQDLKKFMQHSPVVVMAVSGINIIEPIRIIVGPTDARQAAAGSIRGDFALSTQSNIVHASDSAENGKIELERFFTSEEIFDYAKIDEQLIFSDNLM